MPTTYHRPNPEYGNTLLVSRRNQSTRTIIEQWRTQYGGYIVYCTEHDDFREGYNVTDARYEASHPRRWCHRCRDLPEPVRRRRTVDVVLPSTTVLGLNRRFGVEIECTHNELYGFQEVADFIDKTGIDCIYSETGATWRVKEDGSVCTDEGSYEGGYEIVSPPLSGPEGVEQVHKVLRVLREKGFAVNNTCGLHIHLEARDLSVKQIAAFVRAWHDNQELINWFVLDGRRNDRETEYCSPISKYLLEQIESASTKRTLAWTCEERYYSVNLSPLTSFGTIEIRQHHGTLSSTEFESWLRFSIGIIDTICSKGESLGKRVGVRSLLNALPIDDDAKAFLIGRALMRTTRPGALSTIAA